MKKIKLYPRSIDGCSDHECIFNPPNGMGTNGGCRCAKELRRDSPYGFNAIRTITFLRNQLRKIQKEEE